MPHAITRHQPAPGELSACNPNRQHQSWSRWVFEVRVEGKPALDPRYQELVKAKVARFMADNFGRTGQMKMTVYCEAGDLQTGKPPAQMLIVPSIDSVLRMGGK